MSSQEVEASSLEELDTEIAATIAAADALIGGRVVPPIGTGSLSNGAVGSLNDTLDAYNNGEIGPGHCDDVLADD